MSANLDLASLPPPRPQARFLENEQENNKELTARIEVMERVVAKRRDTYMQEQRRVADMNNEVELLKSTLSKAANVLAQKTAECNLARETLERKRANLDALRKKHAGLTAKLTGKFGELDTLEVRDDDTWLTCCMTTCGMTWGGNTATNEAVIAARSWSTLHTCCLMKLAAADRGWLGFAEEEDRRAKHACTQLASNSSIHAPSAPQSQIAELEGLLKAEVRTLEGLRKDKEGMEKERFVRAQELLGLRSKERDLLAEISGAFGASEGIS